MQYTFTCPLEGCNKHTMTVDAKNEKDAEKKLIKQAKEHLANVHQNIKKTDRQVRDDIHSQMSILI